MANWHTPLWLSAVCWMSIACSPETPPADSLSADIPSKPTSEESISEPEPAGNSEPTENSEPTAPRSTSDVTQSNPSQTDPTVTSQALTTAPLQDTTVIPGERVGLITRDTSRVDLVEMFGEAALQDSEIAVGEGFTESGTEVNRETNQAFSVIWVDSSQSRPATVKNFGPDWQTPEGIQVGTSFSDLQTVLGDFQLYGFGWDYGGTIVLEGSDLSNYYGSLILRLQPIDEATFQQQPEAFQAVLGDKLISSQDPNLLPLDLAVSEMVVYLNPPVE